MAQAQRQSVNVGELKELLQKRGVVLPAEKLAQLAAATPVHGEGQVKYVASWSNATLTIVSSDYVFTGTFLQSTLEPTEGGCVIVEAPPKDPERVAAFHVVGGEYLEFLDAAGAVVQKWITPDLADEGEGRGPGRWSTA